MDIGLYLLKFPFRKLIGFMIPYCKNINPNLISIFLLPVGAFIAFIYSQALTSQNGYWFLLGILMLFVRMVIATLDGLVAIHYQKSSRLGDVLNRLTPELCDMMLIPVLLLNEPISTHLVVAVLCFAWATPFFGMLGAPSGMKVQSVGPVGQTDRLAALMIFSILEFLGRHLGWSIDFILIFFYWIIFGGLITLSLRFYRVYRESVLKDGAPQ